MALYVTKADKEKNITDNPMIIERIGEILVILIFNVLLMQTNVNGYKPKYFSVLKVTLPRCCN